MKTQICLDCKNIYVLEPERCECGSRSFEDTYDGNAFAAKDIGKLQGKFFRAKGALNVFKISRLYDNNKQAIIEWVGGRTSYTTRNVIYQFQNNQWKLNESENSTNRERG